jgi:hypothetical protein
LISAGLLLGGCAMQFPISSSQQAPVQQDNASQHSLAWARNDGQLISASPTLTAQAHKDASDCQAAIPPIRTSVGIPGEQCMSARQYHIRGMP